LGTTISNSSNSKQSSENSTSSSSQSNSKTISAGILNSKAINLVTPNYPSAAKAVRASGTVNVSIIVDEKGNVISASAVSGHPLLRGAAEEAAKQSKFTTTNLSGQPVRLQGIVVYNFSP
jgi:protein TonB